MQSSNKFQFLSNTKRFKYIYIQKVRKRTKRGIPTTTRVNIDLTRFHADGIQHPIISMERKFENRRSRSIIRFNCDNTNQLLEILFYH